MFRQGQKGVPAPDADVVKGGFDDRTIVEDRADLPRDRLALFQRRPRRQLIFDLAVITVGRRLELLRDDEQRSEEHTSELQSLMRISYAVFCLKKKNTEKRTL